MNSKERTLEQQLIKKLEQLKYTYRPYIRDKATLEQNLRNKFEQLNRFQSLVRGFMEWTKVEGQKASRA